MNKKLIFLISVIIMVLTIHFTYYKTKTETVLVSGVNIVKKAMRKKSQQDQGGIAEIEAPLNISNVAIVCKKCGPTRIGYKIDGDKKIRVCRKCGDAL